MAQLNGSIQVVDLGGGYGIRAPGVHGTAELKYPRGMAERSRSRLSEDGTTALDTALAATGLTEVRQVDLRVQRPPAVAAAATLRSSDGCQDVLELAVPDLGPDIGQLVLAADEFGVLTWHLPLDAQGLTEPSTTRGSGGVKRFRIPATVLGAAPAAPSANRGLLGTLGHKLLKVLVYPITDPIVGALGEFFTERWETRNRPYGLRDFAPTNFRAASAAPLGVADWARLAQGRALLFIHGTFSTAHAAFAGLPDPVFAELYRRYGGRVFAFNHFTLSHDPRRNVAWLLDQLPDRPLAVDIVCHSRGGLVARTLADPAAMGLGTPNLSVGKIVFVGVPNAGTPLADPDHLVTMLDRLTTALNLFPAGPVEETLEAIITAVKVIGHGTLQGLEGLASMQPGGDFLARLNGGAPSGTGYHAIGADFAPVGDGWKALISGTVADAVLDRVFEQVPNDLVVPEPGVFAVSGCPAFPIPDARRLPVPASAGVIHTTLFGYPPTGERLLDWLTAT
jgi:hypothetical protein